MDISIQKSDLDALGRPSYPGTYPPHYLHDYCKAVLVDLERLTRVDHGEHAEKMKIHLLCGLADNLFRLGISKGAAATRDKVIINLFS